MDVIRTTKAQAYQIIEVQHIRNGGVALLCEDGAFRPRPAKGAARGVFQGDYLVLENDEWHVVEKARFIREYAPPVQEVTLERCEKLLESDISFMQQMIKPRTLHKSQVMRMMCLATFREFTPVDWAGWQGCESEKPLICDDFEGYTLVVDPENERGTLVCVYTQQQLADGAEGEWFILEEAS